MKRKNGPAVDLKESLEKTEQQDGAKVLEWLLGYVH
jgi:hypothetical protein